MKPDLSPGISRGWNRSQAPQLVPASRTRHATLSACPAAIVHPENLETSHRMRLSLRKFPSLVLAPSKRSSKKLGDPHLGEDEEEGKQNPVVQVVQFRGALENLSDCSVAP